MTKLFGANWQTTVTGGLQALISAVVTGSLTFPSNWHSPGQVSVFALVVVATFLGIKFASQAKDKNVTGGVVQQTSDGSVAAAPSATTAVIETIKADPKT